MHSRYHVTADSRRKRRTKAENWRTKAEECGVAIKTDVCGLIIALDRWN